jgi:hypothetical protein
VTREILGAVPHQKRCESGVDLGAGRAASVVSMIDRRDTAPGAASIARLRAPGAQAISDLFAGLTVRGASPISSCPTRSDNSGWTPTPTAPPARSPSARQHAGPPLPSFDTEPTPSDLFGVNSRRRGFVRHSAGSDSITKAGVDCSGGWGSVLRGCIGERSVHSGVDSSPCLVLAHFASEVASGMRPHHRGGPRPRIADELGKPDCCRHGCG